MLTVIQTWHRCLLGSPIGGVKEENGGDGENGGADKVNKGMILRKSVFYIGYISSFFISIFLMQPTTSFLDISDN